MNEHQCWYLQLLEPGLLEAIFNLGNVKFGLGDPAALVFGGDVYHVQKARILGYIVYIMVPVWVDRAPWGWGAGVLIQCLVVLVRPEALGVGDNLNWVNEFWSLLML